MDWVSKGRTSCIAAVLAAGIIISGCSPLPKLYPQEQPSNLPALTELPPPQQKIVAAVYDFPDLTGQYRHTPAGAADFSRAVTQGGAAVLIRALQDAGRGQWFTVVERNQLNHVMTERQIIRDQRQSARDRNGNPLPPPRPLLYAGVIFEGGVIGYDTNTLTGGAGARFLGIGAHTEYREDIVTVYLRAVSSQTGEIWNNVVAAKRIYSYRVQGDVFRFVSNDEILEVEAGFTRNEPRLVALRKAIEEAVTAMIIEGAERQLWAFADAEAAQRLLVANRSGER